MRWARSDEDRALATLLSSSEPRTSGSKSRGASPSSLRSRRQLDTMSISPSSTSGMPSDAQGEGTGKLITPDLLQRLVRESANHWRQPLNE